jgi:hypothetical protein
MSRTRLAGILLFLFIPAVLVLYLRMPFGLAPSVLSGIAIMVLHRRVARPFMDRHLAARCFWCGCDLAGPGLATPFRSAKETIAARTCGVGHAGRLSAFARAVSAWRWILAASILIPVLAYLGNALLAMAERAPLSLDAARWMFKVPIAAAVVGLSLAWPLGRAFANDPAIDFPAHNLSLLGVSWTLWVFRVVGIVWLAQAFSALWSAAGST